MKQNKYIAVEDKANASFKMQWENFKNSCSSEDSSEKKKISESKGGIFFAVAGAKLSEGIDFLDGMARLVVVVGIPYKSRFSSKVS